MPTGPALGENLAKRVAEIYINAEVTTLTKITEQLGEGMDDPDWAPTKLAEIRRLRQGVSDDVISYIDDMMPGEVNAVVRQAYERGGDQAVADLRKLVDEDDIPVTRGFGRIHQQRIEALAAETVERLEPVSSRILRASEDIYRSVIAETVEQTAAGVMTRREAAQSALNKFANRGITGFVDSAGRRWNMASYCEMATRTGTIQSAVEGHRNRMEENGRDLVRVSNHGDECDLCRPHEGRVYSLSGESEQYPPFDQVDGLFHPNCRHTIGAYIPGLSTAVEPRTSPKGYKETQEQRYMERGVRQWKRREAAALDDNERRKASAKRREWQGRLREFTDATDRRREYGREQIGEAI